MPAPIRPSQWCAAVPTTAADFCAKVKLVLVQIPTYLCSLFSWMFNEDGTFTNEFKSIASDLSPGDYKSSASSVVTMGWLYCNGQAVSRVTYAALFSAIGTEHGSGDGSTTFNIPDWRGYFMIGVSAAYPSGSTGGAATVALTLAETPAHQHQIAGRPLDPGLSSNQATNEVIIDDDWTGGSISKTTDSRGSGAAHENLPPYKTAYIYIRY